MRTRHLSPIPYRVITRTRDLGLRVAILSFLILVISSAAIGPALADVASSDARVAANGEHTAYIDELGRLWAWGENNLGQVGDGTENDKNYPVPIASGETWKRVSVGNEHSVAIRSDGTLWTWGANDKGQLGIVGPTSSSTPVQVGTSDQWADVSAGYYHNLALQADGTLWSWGWNWYGQLGTGNNDTYFEPVLVSADVSFIAASSYNASYMIRSDKSLWAWGWNDQGQLGTGSFTESSTPLPVSPGTEWSYVSGGWKHAAGQHIDGTNWVWGDNSYGELGLGGPSYITSPTELISSADLDLMIAANAYSLALDSAGALWGWGWNQNGLLGDGSTESRSTPAFSSSGPWAAIDSGDDQSISLAQDGTVWTWGGANGHGQLGIPGSTSGIVSTMVCFQDGPIPLSEPLLSSASHTVGVLSTDDTVDIDWSGSFDAGCGESGFSVVVDQNATTEPDSVSEQGPDSTGTTTGALGTGSWYVHVKALGRFDVTSPTAHFGPVVIDARKPITIISSGPNERTNSRTVTFTLAAIEDGVGPTMKEVSSSSPSGVTYIYRLIGLDPDWSEPTSATEVSYEDLPDGEYKFEVKARNSIGNVDKTPVSYEFSVLAPNTERLEQNDTGVKYSSGCWSSYSHPNLSGGKANIAKQAGCTAKLTFDGSKIEVIGARAPQLGKVKVYVDNVLEGTVNLYSSTPIFNDVIFTDSYSKPGTHTLKLEVTGTKDRKAKGTYVLLDAFDVTDATGLPTATDLLVSVLYSPQQPQPDSEIDMQVKVTDGNGKPISSAAVVLEIYADPGSGEFEDDIDLCPILEDAGMIDECEAGTDINGNVNIPDLKLLALDTGDRLKVEASAYRSNYEDGYGSAIVTVW